MGDLGLRGRLPIHYQAESLKFSLYSKDEILKLSVVEILNPSSFNHLGHPSENGLYDLKMGPFSSRDHTACSTCHLDAESCSGHIGHIKLPMPVINPLFYQNIRKLLKISCIHCHRLTIRDYLKAMFEAEMTFLRLGLISQAQEVRDLAMSADEKDDKNVELQIKEFVDTELAKHKSQVEKAGENEMPNRMLDGLRKGYVKEMWEIGSSSKSKCHRCGSIVKSIIKGKTGFLYTGTKREDEDDDDLVMSFSLTKSDKKSFGQEKFELNPRDIMQHFRSLYKAEKSVLDCLFPVLKSKSVEHPVDLFFVEVLPVPPPRSRPAQFTEGGLSIHPQTVALTNVVHSVITMRQILKVIGGTPLESLSEEAQEMLKSLQGETPALQLDQVWKELQSDVDHVLDKNMNVSKATTGGWGLKQLIERKEGLFRMNMMGKRVNHACRTVITPDPNVCIDEIGIPEVFAKKLSYPVPVTPFNVRELREMILNGPEKHPGANMIEDEFGRVTYLGKRDYNQRLMIANTLLTPTYRNKYVQRPKIVHRHLMNGDAMLLNRQPTLHRPSIMGHKARVLRGEKVFRLHYSNCKSYNADFDGDEMNAHFPQSENGRSEAYNICLSAHQYLGPKDGGPLQGLIQDHVIAGVKMTLRGTCFTRSEYLQLVFQALQNVPGRIKTLPPSIIKPKMMWSGKQVLSTILINVIPEDKPAPNFAGGAKIRSKLWQNATPRPWKAGGKPEKNDAAMTESDVVIRDGILCSGILDKSQYGATAYSLAHLLYELYGEKSCCSFLSGISKLFTFYLQSMEGFTLGVDDIIVKDKANLKRKEVMKTTADIGDKCAAKGVGAKDEVEGLTLKTMMEESHRSKNPRARMELDAGYKEFLNPATNDINAICVPAGLIKPFPHNNLQLMVNSGAKGSTVNTTQISCLLGQIELEGKRPPVMISGKSLPSFPAYCTLPRAGGYIDGRFMTGIQPQEFYFHCMAGREGLIDTAVKTSRSGYLQRCLIKLLEGLVVHHDFTVRDSDNTVVQFQYGEDSMDICKSQYIKPNRLKDIANNLNSVLDTRSVQVAKDCSDRKAIKSKKKEIKNWGKNPEVEGKDRFSPFLTISSSEELKAKYKGFYKAKLGKNDDLMEISRPKLYGHAYKKYKNLDAETRKELESTVAKKPDPVASSYLPPLHFSSLTEVCDSMINKYVKDNKNNLDADQFKDAMYLKVQKASVCPGEPVGVLAAQSVGEPSTQMTLNTFHFAGRGEMNVTLGIPRLREILMVASANIKTPSLSVPFLPQVGEKERDKLRLRFNRVLVSDILEEVQVKEKLVLKPSRARNITLRYKFIPHKYYKKDFGIKPSQVLAYMESRFFSKVFKPVMMAISKEKMGSLKVTDDKEAKMDSGAGGEGEDADRAAENVADLAMGNLEDSDDEQENMEGEGTDVARKVERQGDREYEDLEDEDIKIKKEARTDQDDEDDLDGDDDKPLVSRNVDEDEALGGMDYEEPEEDDNRVEDQDKLDLLNDELMSSGEAAKRRTSFLANMDAGSAGIGSVIDYKFDADKEQWCEVTFSFDVSTKKPDMVNIIRKSAERGVIHEVKNLKKAFIIEKDGNYHLQTDGINIEVMYKYDHLLDINRLQANNIHDMARYYGIEAAYKTIVQEVKNVFGVYGIEVDYRHLSLIADYMTIDGTYRPFNRIGIDNNPSPLQQMTFETAIGFLRAATLGAKQDHLSSPSACIIAGKQAKVGTGSVHLQYKL